MSDRSRESPGEITRLLISWREGDQGARDRLFSLVYDQLRHLARGQLRRAAPGATLTTTDVVHEACLRLVDPGTSDPRDRQHFFALAATAMRHLLIDRARRRGAVKRGGRAPEASLDEAVIPARAPSAEILDVDHALSRLEALDPRLGRVVELRFFGGLSMEEIAGILDLSVRTVKRDWRRARAFLYAQLEGEPIP